mgnify:CR=1 FL=1
MDNIKKTYEPYIKVYIDCCYEQKEYAKSKGFKFAKVSIPKQEVQNGIIIIAIEEGQVDSKNLESNITYV